jgi:hypothetical protein
VVTEAFPNDARILLNTALSLAAGLQLAVPSQGVVPERDMLRSGETADRGRAGSSASALLLLQAAASQARIGPFAFRGLASPQSAAALYRSVARLAVPAIGRR